MATKALIITEISMDEVLRILIPVDEVGAADEVEADEEAMTTGEMTAKLVIKVKFVVTTVTNTVTLRGSARNRKINLKNNKRI